MKTLEQYNKEVYDKLRKNSRYKTGIECPKCKSELIYINPDRFFVKENVIDCFAYTTVGCDCGFTTDIIS